MLFANINGREQSVLERISKRINKIGKMSASDVQALNNIADVKGDMKEITKELNMSIPNYRLDKIFLVFAFRPPSYLYKKALQKHRMVLLQG